MANIKFSQFTNQTSFAGVQDLVGYSPSGVNVKISPSNLISTYLADGANNTTVVNGVVNNLASQGTGGYDFMEWTSNVTSSTQIPLWRNPSDFEIVAVTFAWMGATALSIAAGDQVNFEIGYITNNMSAQIANFNAISNLFTIDSTYNGLFASGEVEFATPISLAKYQNIGIVGTELGAVTPNNGELSISLLLRNIP